MAFSQYSFRAFLNKRGFHSDAYVSAGVDVVDDVWGEGGRKQVEARFAVADCGRIMTLDFSCADAGEVANALHKARVLRRVVAEFIDALEGAIAEAGPFEHRSGMPSPPSIR